MNLETTIIAAFIGAVVALFGFIAAHRLSFWRERHARHVSACIAFRSVVLAELGLVYPYSHNWPNDINFFLHSHFTVLQTAVENFSPFVPWWKRRSVMRAWVRFHSSNSDARSQSYYHYLEFGSNPNYKTIFHDNVKHLLSFANET